MPVAPVRRARPARRNANYRRDPEPATVYGPVSDASDLESDVSESSDQVNLAKPDDMYMTEESVEDAEHDIEEEEELLEEELEDIEVEEEEIPLEELGDEDAEGEEEDELDVDVEEETVDGTELGDEEMEVLEDDSEDEEEEEEDEVEEEADEGEETSDYEEIRTSRTKATQKTRLRLKQPLLSIKQQPSRQKQSLQASRIAALKKKDSPIQSLLRRGDGPTVLTKRQRAKLNDDYQHDLLELPMEPIKKKHLTEEEIALKKSETARRRKHQSIQRAEQDKMDTINRLLKKQNTKRRSKDQEDIEINQENKKDGGSKSSKLPGIRYITNLDGFTLSLPEGYELPIPFSKGPNYPSPLPLCSFPGCRHRKKYRSVKNLMFACSMEHLKKIEGKVQ